MCGHFSTLLIEVQISVVVLHTSSGLRMMKTAFLIDAICYFPLKDYGLHGAVSGNTTSANASPSHRKFSLKCNETLMNGIGCDLYHLP
jgi:hypothetical protein